MEKSMVFWFCYFTLICSINSQYDSRETIDSTTIQQLRRQLEQLKLDAEINFAKTSSRSAQETEVYIKSIPAIGSKIMDAINTRYSINNQDECRRALMKRLDVIKDNTHILAEHNADNHQKYIIGYIIVVKMHLNKSEDLINKLENKMQQCVQETTSQCENNFQLELRKMYKHLINEVQRVKSELSHIMPAYKDIIIHSRRRLNRFSRKAEKDTIKAARRFKICRHTKK